MTKEAAVAGIYEDNIYVEEEYGEGTTAFQVDEILAGQFVQEYRMYYEQALNDSNFLWIADMVIGDAYTELESYIADIADEGHSFYFNTNDILDVVSYDGAYIVEMNETFDFYSANGEYEYFDRYKTYTVVEDEYGAFKIIDIAIQ